MLAIRRPDRGNDWYAYFRFRKRRVRRLSPIQTRNGTEQFARTLLREFGEALAQGRDPFAGPPPTFAEFAELWMREYVIPKNRPSTQREKRSALTSRLIPSFGHLRLDEITTLRIDQAISEWDKTKLSPKSINNSLTILRKCLSIAEDWGYLAHVPKIRWKTVVLPDPKYLTRDEFERLIAATEPGFWRTLVLFVLRTGVRFGEAMGLRWEDLDLSEPAPSVHIRRAVEHGNIGEPKTKAGKRIIPLDAETAASLRAFQHGNPFVFSRDDGRFYRHDTCSRYLARACERAGIKRVTWHPLRHSCATEHVTCGTPLVVIKDLLGHTDIKMTCRYAHATEETKRIHVERVAARGALLPVEVSTGCPPRSELSERATTAM